MTVRQHIEYFFVALFRFMLRIMPRKAALWCGRRLGDLFFSLDKKHCDLIIDNLTLAYGDELTEERKQEIARGCYQHFGSILFDMLRTRRLTKKFIEENITIEGWEHLEEAERMGKGVLVLTAHLGFWEYMGIVQGFHGKNLQVLARELDNPKLEKILYDYRTLTGNIVLYKENAVKAILEVLKNKGMAAVLIDQNVNPNRGIFVDFFGEKACTTTVVSALAIRTGAPIVPAFSFPEADGCWRFIYEKPLVYDPDDRSREKIAEVTQECTSIIESYIRRQPEIWLWMHRRWKTRPPEEQEGQEEQRADT